MQDINEPERLSRLYRKITQELTGGAEVTTRAAAAEQAFIGALPDVKKAGRLLAGAMGEMPWIWSTWEQQAKSHSRHTVSSIERGHARMSAEDMAGLAGKEELFELLTGAGQALKKSASKASLIAQIKALAPSAAKALLQPVVARLFEYELSSCRKQIAEHLASRVTMLAYHEQRYEQLQTIASRPNWRFVCAAPCKACKKFHDRSLPVAQAKLSFPKVPCDELFCFCRIVSADSTDQS